MTLTYECEDPTASLSLEPGNLLLSGAGSAAVTIEASIRYVLRAENEDGVRTEALEVIVDDRLKFVPSR